MLMVYQIRPERRSEIPAVTHVDGSGRLQTVSAKLNPLYYRLISEFYKLTGVPVVLNTSFNENEPIVWHAPPRDRLPGKLAWMCCIWNSRHSAATELVIEYSAE